MISTSHPTVLPLAEDETHSHHRQSSRQLVHGDRVPVCVNADSCQSGGLHILVSKYYFK